jgi:hypothetical protein
MLPQFSLRKLAPSGMVIVVVLDFRMAIKAEGNAIFKAVVAALLLWLEMMRLNAYAAKFAAYAT